MPHSSDDLIRYLAPGRFVDSDHPAVLAYARRHTAGLSDPREQAVALYYAVRDGFQYNPYQLDLRPEAMKASALLNRSRGYCVEKANLLAAAARAVGIPSRLGFANVRNHIGTARLEKLLQSDVLVFHGYTELYLRDCWVKATPAFNRELCQKLNVPPLEFDGREDSLFQQFTSDGTRFMEYLHDYGTFTDIPRRLFLQELERHYPHIFRETLRGGQRRFSLEEE